LTPEKAKKNPGEPEISERRQADKRKKRLNGSKGIRNSAYSQERRRELKESLLERRRRKWVETTVAKIDVVGPLTKRRARRKPRCAKKEWSKRKEGKHAQEEGTRLFFEED